MSKTPKPQPNSDQNSEPGEKLYSLRLTYVGPADPELAASLQEVFEAADRDPNRWHNNPAKQRAALEGLGKFLDEWEAENGAITEEDLNRAGNPHLYERVIDAGSGHH